MNEQNSGQLEREAEEIRAGIAQTAEALQDRMSPGRIVDEFMTYMKNSDGTLALDNLRRQARDNPLALAMIGSGFAWLAFGGGSHRPSASDDTASDIGRGRSHSSAYASYPRADTEREGGTLSDTVSAVGDAASGFAEKAGEFAGQARDAAGHAAARVRDTAGELSDRARRMRHDAADRGYAAADDVRDMAQRGRQSIMDALEREPLVLGAIGVAVGAALGAMLPSTRFENTTFGKTRDSLLREAEKAVDHAAEAARKVGGEALEAAKSAAQTNEGKTVAERAGDVARAALSAGKDAAEREIGTAAEGTADHGAADTEGRR